MARVSPGRASGLLWPRRVELMDPVQTGESADGPARRAGSALICAEPESRRVVPELKGWASLIGSLF